MFGLIESQHQMANTIAIVPEPSCVFALFVAQKIVVQRITQLGRNSTPVFAQRLDSNEILLGQNAVGALECLNRAFQERSDD